VVRSGSTGWRPSSGRQCGRWQWQRQWRWHMVGYYMDVARCSRFIQPLTVLYREQVPSVASSTWRLCQSARRDVASSRYLSSSSSRARPLYSHLAHRQLTTINIDASLAHNWWWFKPVKAVKKTREAARFRSSFISYANSVLWCETLTLLFVFDVVVVTSTLTCHWKQKWRTQGA